MNHLFWHPSLQSNTAELGDIIPAQGSLVYFVERGCWSNPRVFRVYTWLCAHGIPQGIRNWGLVLGIEQRLDACKYYVF